MESKRLFPPSPLLSSPLLSSPLLSSPSPLPPLRPDRRLPHPGLLQLLRPRVGREHPPQVRRREPVPPGPADKGLVEPAEVGRRVAVPAVEGTRERLRGGEPAAEGLDQGVALREELAEARVTGGALEREGERKKKKMRERGFRVSRGESLWKKEKKTKRAFGRRKKKTKERRGNGKKKIRKPPSLSP